MFFVKIFYMKQCYINELYFNKFKLAPSHCVNRQHEVILQACVYKNQCGWHLIFMIFAVHETYRETGRERERNCQFYGHWVKQQRSQWAAALSTYSSPPTVAFYLPWCQRSARSLQSFWSRGEKTTSEPECLSISSRNLRVLFLKLNINIRHTSLWLSDNGSRLNSWLLKQWLLTLIQTQLLCSGYPKFN